ncbi:hypothetical protein OG912_30560 [Streptomyces sp. NBC_00464]|uniref:hypothetical protein n=1 Tax=Streptomyces sp. NBC_00464 TaxID=2975751 RepID=UPI002E170812
MRQETIWLRAKRYNAYGGVVSGTGGVGHPRFAAPPTPAQRRDPAAVGIRGRGPAAPGQ